MRNSMPYEKKFDHMFLVVEKIDVQLIEAIALKYRF